MSGVTYFQPNSHEHQFANSFLDAIKYAFAWNYIFNPNGFFALLGVELKMRQANVHECNTPNARMCLPSCARLYIRFLLFSRRQSTGSKSNLMIQLNFPERFSVGNASVSMQTDAEWRDEAKQNQTAYLQILFNLWWRWYSFASKQYELNVKQGYLLLSLAIPL